MLNAVCIICRILSNQELNEASWATVTPCRLNWRRYCVGCWRDTAESTQFRLWGLFCRTSDNLWSKRTSSSSSSSALAAAAAIVLSSLPVYTKIEFYAIWGWSRPIRKRSKWYNSDCR